MANLPRSLPGETVTLMLFGNTTLDNQSNNLEAFYFSSQLGQVVCDKVPFDGLKIDVPEGSGVQFKINGTELTLMGNASLKANKGEAWMSACTVARGKSWRTARNNTSAQDKKSVLNWVGITACRP